MSNLYSSKASSAAIIGGVFSLSAPVPSDGQGCALQLDSAGNLLVNVAVGGGGGSGVQYVDGVTQATPTGTVALGKNPSNVLHSLALSASGNLNVNLAEGTISGGNAAASPTGAAVPGSADYQGVNIAGNLVGVTGLALGATTKAPTVAIVDGAGNQITSFGGGVQFADNAASGATPTGTLSMGWDSVNSKVRALKVDASQNLLVAGTVTANIGTTGGLALDASLTTIDTDIKATQPRDVTDRVGRLLGHVTVDNATLAVTGTVDVSDRAARLLGVVYGSQGQQLKQTATNFNSQVELATGATLYDARQIRALTSADVVSAAQSGAWTVTANQGGAPWSQRIQDGAGATLATVTGANALKVDGSAVTQPVSGAFFQATQPVSIAATVNVSVQNATLAVTQSTSPWVENVSQFGGSPVVTGTGVSGAGIPRVTVSSDSFPVSQIVTQATGTNLHVVVDAAPAVTVAAASPIDEYGNKQMVAEDVFPWRQALLDEMRAVRLGMQVLCEYMHPASGTPGPSSVSPVNAVIFSSRLQNTEEDLIAMAQSIRDGSEEVIQG